MQFSHFVHLQFVAAADSVAVVVVAFAKQAKHKRHFMPKTKQHKKAHSIL